MDKRNSLIRWIPFLTGLFIGGIAAILFFLSYFGFSPLLFHDGKEIHASR